MHFIQEVNLNASLNVYIFDKNYHFNCTIQVQSASVHSQEVVNQQVASKQQNNTDNDLGTFYVLGSADATPIRSTLGGTFHCDLASGPPGKQQERQ